MRKFINEEMSAPNVLRVPINFDATRQLGSIVTSKFARARLYWEAPAWHSDIRWYSSRFMADFRRFSSLFDRLGVAQHVQPYVDLADEVRLYNSFLVVRSTCLRPHFHVDWENAGNEGFTLMTPLTENCSGFGMLYRRLDGSIGEYDYRLGEAVIFGDDFIHSTKPGVSDQPVVLLCFNFGTDKMEHWPKIERTAGRQALLTRRPNGTLHRRPLSVRIRGKVGRLRRKIGLGPRSLQEIAY